MWTSPDTVDTPQPHFEALSNTSGLTPPTHPGTPVLGWKRFAELCSDLPMPVYAPGGMRLDMLDNARDHGAHGVALLSAVWK